MAAGDRVVEEEGGPDGDAEPGNGCLAQKVAIVGPQVRTHGHAARVVVRRAVVPVVRFRKIAVDQARVVGECFRGLRCAMTFQIGRAGAHRTVGGPQAAGNEARVFQACDTYGDVDVLLDQVHLPVVEVEIELHIGMGLHELGDGRAHVQQSEGHRCRHPQPAAQGALFLAHRRLRFFHVGQDAHAAFIVAAPGVGQVHASGSAAKQLGAQSGLELG